VEQHLRHPHKPSQAKLYLHAFSTSEVKHVWSLASVRHYGAVYGHKFTIPLAVTLTGDQRLLKTK
jgi:hypothetical protein